IPMYKYLLPVIVLLTFVTNLFVCVVLTTKQMRNPTNMLLVAMAISDTLTGLIPAPISIYLYTMEYHKDYVPYNLCYCKEMTETHLPTVFHTASIWLIVVLSLQRYICVCHHQLAIRICTMKNCRRVIVGIYICAFLSQVLRLVHHHYHHHYHYHYQQHHHWQRHLYNVSLVLGLYWWFRVVTVNFIPCTLLTILNALLFLAMKKAQKRREILFKQNRRTESKRLAENNLATLMLFTVVGVFLAVEFPLVVLMATLIYENTANEDLIATETRSIAASLINLLILLSYPVNFFIYCGMSKQFRETFVKLFLSG
ncbi:hypothetical protein HELRODRAFT_122103, partial [Helobdella robusta]|uniref:G-protein coupled receptors family 1 profile domain-containing protein n=1 Tax=Helobdella robusta TaxID=6412 RepID=T1EGT9_HELRO